MHSMTRKGGGFYEEGSLNFWGIRYDTHFVLGYHLHLRLFSTAAHRTTNAFYKGVYTPVTVRK